MRNRRCFCRTLIVVASILLTGMFLIACNASKDNTPKEAALAPSPATKEVFVVFEGPWAFAPDPKDANKVLALAPKTKIHRDLYVTASNNSTLAAGIYDLSVPLSGGAGAATPDANILQAKTTASNVQRVLDTKLERYAIRLPKPDAYVPAARFRSRVGPTYPPDVSTEKEYVTSVSLHYSVSSLTGFSLAGSPDTGSFNPFLLQVDTPNVRFVIDPAHEDDPSDKCRTHSRESFRDLTGLLKLTLYVDFPDSPSTCHDKDPQRSKTAHDGRPSSLEALATLLGGNLGDVQMASVDPEMAAGYQVFPYHWQAASSTKQHLLAAFYLFGRPSGACTAPILLLGTN